MRGNAWPLGKHKRGSVIRESPVVTCSHAETFGFTRLCLLGSSLYPHREWWLGRLAEQAILGIPTDRNDPG